MWVLTKMSVLILAVLTAVLPCSAQELGLNRNLASSADVLPPSTATPASGCSTSECHPGIKEHTYLHGPLQINSCDACHSLSDAAKHRFEDVLPRQQLCVSCHDLSYSLRQESIHKPVSEGECLGCHDPHGSEQPRAILSNDRAALCLSCHDALTGGERPVHAPESKGACNTCHAPHSSDHGKLLNDSGRTLCLSCHVKTAELLASSPLQHEPTKGDCQLCHDPHATGDTSMLIAEPKTLCLSCHQEVADSLDVVTHPHAAMTQDKSCLNCHQPHASEHGQLLRGATADLCYQCHDKEVKRASGGVIPSIMNRIAESPNSHSPAARGDCTLCHQVHGNDRERLLKQEYSPTYSSFEDADKYSLCFSCHDKNLALSETTNAITAFRNGDQNLHFAHVNSRKSRSCNICHDPHAADAEHMIRSTFPFGPSRWPLAIAWQSKPNGGSCAAGCHAAFDYDRENAVIYPAIPLDDQDWRGRMPGEPAETTPEEIR